MMHVAVLVLASHRVYCCLPSEHHVIIAAMLTDRGRPCNKKVGTRARGNKNKKSWCATIVLIIILDADDFERY